MRLARTLAVIPALITVLTGAHADPALALPVRENLVATAGETLRGTFSSREPIALFVEGAKMDTAFDKTEYAQGQGPYEPIVEPVWLFLFGGTGAALWLVTRRARASRRLDRSSAVVVGFNQFVLKIKRRESPFYTRLYRLGKRIRHFEIPTVPLLHLALYYERLVRRTAWHTLTRILYYQPLFQSRCEAVGRGLHIEHGIPMVAGHLRIRLGDYVRINGVTTFSAAPRADDPVLEIGDHSYIGYAVTISVGSRVRIGRHVLVASRVLIAGDDGHPLDPIERRSWPAAGTAVTEIEDDAWIGESAIILKNIRIGRAAIVGAGSVVTRDVAPFTVVAGNPARVVKILPEGALAPDGRWQGRLLPDWGG